MLESNGGPGICPWGAVYCLTYIDFTFLIRYPLYKWYMFSDNHKYYEVEELATLLKARSHYHVLCYSYWAREGSTAPLIRYAFLYLLYIRIPLFIQYLCLTLIISSSAHHLIIRLSSFEYCLGPNSMDVPIYLQHCTKTRAAWQKTGDRQIKVGGRQNVADKKEMKREESMCQLYFVTKFKFCIQFFSCFYVPLGS